MESLLGCQASEECFDSYYYYFYYFTYYFLNLFLHFQKSHKTLKYALLFFGVFFNKVGKGNLKIGRKELGNNHFLPQLNRFPPWIMVSCKELVWAFKGRDNGRKLPRRSTIDYRSKLKLHVISRKTKENFVLQHGSNEHTKFIKRVFPVEQSFYFF